MKENLLQRAGRAALLPKFLPCADGNQLAAENGKGFCRACFATSYEQLIEAATRIERHV